MNEISSFPGWEHASETWTWAAQDEDGRCFWYSVKPMASIGGGVWRAPSRAQCLACVGTPNTEWFNTLLERPRVL